MIHIKTIQKNKLGTKKDGKLKVSNRIHRKTSPLHWCIELAELFSCAERRVMEEKGQWRVAGHQWPSAFVQKIIKDDF